MRLIRARAFLVPLIAASVLRCDATDPMVDYGSPSVSAEVTELSGNLFAPGDTFEIAVTGLDETALAWIGFELLELDGLAVALALSTLFVLAALLRELGMLGTGLRGILRAAVAIGALAVVAFLPPSLVLGTVVAAIVGVVLYVVLVAVWRPTGLTRSWGYLRDLR